MSSDSLPTGLQARACVRPDHTADHTHLDVPASGRVILRLLEKLQHGALRLRTPDGSILLYGDG
ncbi:MAG: SAM-dependent methyltransferase, partial [Janthinobacterium sp.]